MVGINVQDGNIKMNLYRNFVGKQIEIEKKIME